MALGVRVVRGPAWNLGNQDGGANHTGTVAALLADDRVRVQWDMGSSTVCRAGQSGPHDLRVFDTAPTGARHQYVVCDECNEENIRGIRWKCAVCDDYDLCTPCYLDDGHKTMHAFLRIDSHGSTPMKLSKRSVSQRQRVMGMFPNAEVVRGPDWSRGNEDGGKGKVGTIEDIVSWLDGEILRDAVRVQWPSGDVCKYRLGYEGKVDLVCQEEAPGPDYYPDHLPVLDVTAYLPVAAAVKSTTQSQMQAGDKVCVDMSTAEFKAIQMRRLAWNSIIEEIVGDILTVQRVTREGDCVIDYYDRFLIIDKDAVTKIPSHKKHDAVRVIDSTERLHRLQRNHGGWVDGVTEVKGRTGRVTVIDSDGDVAVTFGDVDYVFHPLCLVPVSADESASCSISDDDDEEELSLGMHVGASKDSDDEDEDGNAGDALDLLQGLAGLMLLETLTRRSTSDVKVDFVKAVVEGDALSVKRLLKQHPGLKHIAYQDMPCFVIAVIKEHETIVRIMLDAGVDIDIQGKSGNTALIMAMSKENSSIATLLIIRGADVNIQNGNKQTALHAAVREGFVAGVKMLLAAGADINKQDVSGDTPLHDAIAKEQDIIAQLLIKQPGINVWLKNKKEFTPMGFACLKAHAVSVDALISKEPRLVTSPDGRSSGGFYPLHIVAINNHVLEAKLLLQKGKADVDSLNVNMATPLHLAAAKGSVTMVELLLSSGADCNIKDCDGDTPLHECLRGRPSGGLFLQLLLGVGSDSGAGEKVRTAELLIQHGADPDIRNGRRQSPLDVCSNSRVRMEVERIISRRRLTTSGADSRTSLFDFLLRRRCRRCDSAPADTRFVPCDHTVACRKCCHTYNRCPVCDRLILRVVAK